MCVCREIGGQGDGCVCVGRQGGRGMVVCVHAYLCHPVICSGKRLQVMVEVVMRLCSLQTRTYLSRFSFKHSKTVSSAVLIALMTDGQNMQTAYATYVGAVDRMSGHMNRQ